MSVSSPSAAGAAVEPTGGRALVIGTGTMGQGIAQLCAAAGWRTHVFDVERARLEAAERAIVAGLGRAVDKGKLTAAARDAALARLIGFADLEAASEGVGLVIEAVPEDMALKVDVLARVRDRARDDALLASNTSSLSITELGRRLGAGTRTVGMHFFNPPPVMELVEVVRGLHSSTATVERACELARALGKTTIVVSDTPGFATSRLGVAIGAEAIRMVEAGVASVGDIDRAMELGYRHPMGPLKLGDLVGLDVRLAILEHLHREVGEQFRPPSLLRQMVRAGWLGKKSGRGFYRWTEAGAEPTDPRRGDV
ncbi:MAG: 3-hydroxyacyl-CoA dehydrogenase family protein [Polyangiaceae bacterium]|nr:3-hydroxyacyl-CoA dehydrogenase family protein [Polyangiaceae bacterium]